MTLETAVIFALSIVLLYIKPGPNQAMKITRCLNDGFFPAWYFTMGATSTVIFYFIIATIGTGFVQSAIQTTGFYFRIVGGIYLLYLAYKGFSNLERGVWSGRKNQDHKKDFIENYSLGFVMTLANPITIFYFIGIAPSLIGVGSFDMQDTLLGVFLIAFFGNLADIILIALVSEAKKSLSDTGFVKKINIVSSSGFLLIALFFIYSAFFMHDFSYEL